ncbi:DUF485 domain-containing protein [Pinisolibacter sp.]|uniref:DUF485 domain-containing protein n=1 Tax=Pinisolibacter sp. TaxID=2172024 RepID=UPI002FDE8FB2
MSNDIAAKVRANPKFQELVSTRNSLSLKLTIATLVLYYGYILLIGFDPKLLAMKVGSGVTTLGMPVGVVVIVLSFVIVGIYVRKANASFDQLTKEIVEETK